MGKRIRVQRLGRGSPSFRRPDHRRKVAKVAYPPLSDELLRGQVTDLFHDVGRSYPVAEITLEDGRVFYVPAAEGIMLNDWIEIGPGASLAVGNIVPLGELEEGSPVFNIEGTPGDGGKYVRSAGAYAVIKTKSGGKVYVELPSGKVRIFDEKCRATVGNVAGGGRHDKPFVKAGKKYHAMRAMNKMWPKVRGVAMNVVDHPHGGKEHHPPGPTTVARNTPPGRKVGHIAARRTGRRKR
ncbi:MAG: 50S ribosomal protein L2 [Candidatus Diapherotrites archaeon]|nr:50S ribosomal protein L2 [Candidatus Diapherotrites archaeon]